MYSTTGSFHATLIHTILSHFIPSTLSILLHLTRIRSSPSSPHFEIFAMYSAALFVVLRSTTLPTTANHPPTGHPASLTSGSHLSMDSDASTADYLNTPAGRFLKGPASVRSLSRSESRSALDDSEDTPVDLHKSDSGWSGYSNNSSNSTYSSGPDLAPAVTDHAVKATNHLLKSVRNVREHDHSL